MLTKTKKRAKCLRCGCKNLAEWRGVCIKHYMETRRAKKAGEATDEQLIKIGALLPAQKGPLRSKSRSELSRMLAKSAK